MCTCSVYKTILEISLCSEVIEMNKRVVLIDVEAEAAQWRQPQKQQAV